MTTNENRIVIGEPESAYHKRTIGVASKSALDQIARSPAHYRAWVEGEDREPTPALEFGRAVHMAILEPSRFASAYIVAPDFGDLRSSKNREARDAWREQNPGAVVISQADYDTIGGMLRSVMLHPAASKLIADGTPEVSLYWRDAITGLRCKARADYWVKSKGLVIDLKSTLDASPREFARSVIKYRYHVQDASYRAAFHACGEPITHFAILAVEKTAPYACAVYTLDTDAVARGFGAYRLDMSALAECIKTNRFPSYSEGVEELSLPAWAA